MLAARIVRILRNNLLVLALSGAFILYCCFVLFDTMAGMRSIVRVRQKGESIVVLPSDALDELLSASNTRVATFSSLDHKVTGDPDISVRQKEFQWDLPTEEQPWSNSTQKTVITCRNSVQGKALLADDRGYVCQRSDRLGSGCCDTTSSNTYRHYCLTCNSQHCCAIYEYCVSCCMHPDQKSLLKRVLKQVSEGSPLYASVSDQFELCLVKCRTSSQSVQHETLYRDPRAKHCFGERLPALHSDNDT